MKHVSELVEPFESCGICSKDGWIAVTIEGPWAKEKDVEQVRCRCWHVHQQKILEAISAKAKQGKR